MKQSRFQNWKTVSVSCKVRDNAAAAHAAHHTRAHHLSMHQIVSALSARGPSLLAFFRGRQQQPQNTDGTCVSEKQVQAKKVVMFFCESFLASTRTKCPSGSKGLTG